MYALTMADGQCGECQECCVRLLIHEPPEYRKDEYVPCRFLANKGCGVYDERPDTCRDFQCMWLQGDIPGDERRRPDKLGVMFYPSRMWEGTIAAMECRPRALDTPEVRYIGDRLEKRTGLTIKRWPYEPDGPSRLEAYLASKEAEEALMEALQDAALI